MKEMNNGGSGSNWKGSDHVISSTGLDDENNEKRITPFEKLSIDLTNDQRVLKEITLGKRIGFYRIRGELGSGNFSQVKMGIHALTRGKMFVKMHTHCLWKFQGYICILGTGEKRSSGKDKMIFSGLVM